MRKVFLTFDDGPSEYTLKILEILKKFKIKATFFVCGKNCQKYPSVLRQILNEGHSLGHHSFSHSLKFFFNFKKEIEKTNEIFKEIVGKETKLFRPPWGFLFLPLKNYLLKNGYRIVLWDIDLLDWCWWRPINSFERLDKRIKRLNKDDITILLHERLKTVLNLEKLLTNLKKGNFEFAKW